MRSHRALGPGERVDTAGALGERRPVDTQRRRDRLPTVVRGRDLERPCDGRRESVILQHHCATCTSELKRRLHDVDRAEILPDEAGDVPCHIHHPRCRDGIRGRGCERFRRREAKCPAVWQQLGCAWHWNVRGRAHQTKQVGARRRQWLVEADVEHRGQRHVQAAHGGNGLDALHHGGPDVTAIDRILEIQRLSPWLRQRERQITDVARRNECFDACRSEAPGLRSDAIEPDLDSTMES